MYTQSRLFVLFQVDAALAPGYPDDPLVEGFRVTLKRSDVATLSNLNWLNDEVRLHFEIVVPSFVVKGGLGWFTLVGFCFKAVLS